MPDRRRVVVAAVVLSLVVAACGGDDDDAGDARGARLEVVASFYPVSEAATRVGGARVRVTNLTPPGVEPHDIELTPRQVDRLEDADLVIYVGEGFQPAVEKIAERGDADTLDLLEGFDLLKSVPFDGQEDEEGQEHDDADFDPHFWLDPLLMAEAVDAVTEALADASPDDAGTFQTNAKRYKAELSGLHAEFQQGLSTCGGKEIVTSHAAFSYLAQRYGLTQLPIAGVSPEAEPDADRLATLADEIEGKGITTVFFEELVSPKVAETLAREAGVKTAVLSPIEGLSDEDRDAGKDYVDVMRDNLVALRQALGCR